ncbi:MAG: hypothetical protein GF393_07835, partial [Armatimonadia bacterium]|nr:hypothetical protein [Armatimonadia bacterium]
MRHLVTAALTIALTVSAWGADDIVWRFDTDGDFEGWTPSHFQSVEVSDGMLRGVTEYDCMLGSPELSIDASEYSVIEFRVSSSITGGGEIFWHGPDGRFTDDVKLRHVIQASEDPRVYRSAVGETAQWQGTISRIRVDILNPADAEIALDYIRLTNAPEGVVPNTSFENDFDGDGAPDGWAIDAAGSAWSTEHTTQGDRSLMIEASRPDHRVASATMRTPIDRTGIYRLRATATYVQGGVKELAAELRFFDVFGKPLRGDVRLSAGKPDEEGHRSITGEFEVPQLSASADLSLVAESGGARVWWDDVVLAHIVETPPSCEEPMESWSAKWIWAEATHGQDDAPAYFLRRFELPTRLQRITSAKLQITADDMYTLWLNGEKISESTDADGWRTPEVVDLQPHLVEGTNVLAVEARDVSSAEGLLAEGAINWKRGSMALR